MVTILDRDEVKILVNVWPANARAPLTRDEVIAFIRAKQKARQESYK